MKTGTKSLLWGVHQIVIHPITVFLAWRKLYGWPNWKEMVCIVIHDWGYWGKAHMNDEAGEKHPEWAAEFALRFLDVVDPPCPFWNLCIFHSRHYARNYNTKPSKLCFADKLALMYDPWWLYIPRALASGELAEYREDAARVGTVSMSATHREWHEYVQRVNAYMGVMQDPTATPYLNPLRGTEKEE